MPKYPVDGVYVTTLPVRDAVPLPGGDTIAMPVKKPLILAVRSITDAVLNATVTALSAVTGGGGAATLSVTVAGVDVPPGPVAV